MEVGLFLRTEAELTGEARSVQGWVDDDDEEDVCIAGRVAALG